MAGRRVTVVEAGTDAGQGWQAAAGMLAPQIEAHVEDPLLEIGLAGREYYADHREALEAAAATSIGLQLTGILNLAYTEAEAGWLRDQVATSAS
jgi:glycine/D-amino acid oxidase-like deaminating enzyme